MSDTALPRWVDDLFRYPTPPPFAALIDIAWRDVTRDGCYYWLDLATYFNCMFELTAVPASPEGWPPADDAEESRRRPTDPPLWAVPEFETFGNLSNGAHLGWMVGAPELERTDHPVGQLGPYEPGVVQLGRDTRAALQFLLSRTLRWWREDTRHADEPWRLDDRRLIDRLARDLGLHPDADLGVDPNVSIEYEVPAGWRHHLSADGVGVLAPAHTFTQREPVTWHDDIELVLADVGRLLDAGFPATALLEIRDTFHHTRLYLPELAPLWERAYYDLGRPGLAAAVYSITW